MARTAGATTLRDRRSRRLRPQTLRQRRRRPTSRDPIVEPLWVGRPGPRRRRRRRRRARRRGRRVTVEGYRRDRRRARRGGLSDRRSSSTAILTKQALQTAVAVYTWSDEVALDGLVHRRCAAIARSDTLKLPTKEARPGGPHLHCPTSEVSFVAIDLLWLDDKSLLDVPLLERRRLLESRPRRSRTWSGSGAFIRPPIESWVGSWRAQGFAGLTYKAANSRYHAGRGEARLGRSSGMPAPLTDRVTVVR